MVGELPNHIELIYKNAEDNLRFIKQQQWSIARYALTAYGALFVVAKTIRAECADKVLLVLAAWLVAVFSVLILWSLIESMATFRGRIAWVYASYFRSEKKKGLPVGANRGRKLSSRRVPASADRTARQWDAVTGKPNRSATGGP
jgi:hypothetical protein